MFKKRSEFPKDKLKELAETPMDELQIRFPDFKRDDLRFLRRKQTATLRPKAKEKKISPQKFLTKARTRKELVTRFGDKVDEVLATKFDGLNLFEQVNEFGENVYALLPAPSLDAVKVLPKDWKFTLGKEPNGEAQPYICVQLPRFKGKTQIALLYDVHYGHAKHRKEKFQSYIDWIRRSPNVYAILGGDLMENAIDDGRGMSYDQSENPHSQLDDMTKLLAPIAHKILFSVPGNHEERTFKKTGIDVARVFADRLEIPYFSGPVFCSILANGHKWTVFAQHGRGNSQTKGGKMNMASRPASFVSNVDFIVCGHVHDRVSEAQTIIVEDSANFRLAYKNQWTVIAPAFLGWMDTYAYRAGYRPPSLGGVAIYLYEDGTSKADQT